MVFEWLSDFKRACNYFRQQESIERVQQHSLTKQDNVLLIFDLLMFQTVRNFQSDLLCCNLFAIFCQPLIFLAMRVGTTAANVSFSPEQMIYACACTHTHAEWQYFANIQRMRSVLCYRLHLSAPLPHSNTHYFCLIKIF